MASTNNVSGFAICSDFGTIQIPWCIRVKLHKWSTTFACEHNRKTCWQVEERPQHLPGTTIRQMPTHRLGHFQSHPCQNRDWHPLRLRQGGISFGPGLGGGNLRPISKGQEEIAQNPAGLACTSRLSIKHGQEEHRRLADQENPHRKRDDGCPTVFSPAQILASVVRGISPDRVGQPKSIRPSDPGHLPGLGGSHF